MKPPVTKLKVCKLRSMLLETELSIRKKLLNRDKTSLELYKVE